MLPLKITVPEPCAQSWANMSPTDKGRYCNSCEKEVIDFRDWNTDELQNWFLNHQNVCGLFLREQIFVESNAVKPSKWNLAKGIFLASCLALFAGAKAYAKPVATTVLEEKKDRKPDFSTQALATDTLITVSGRIKDFKDKIDLPGVKVSMPNGQSTVTDAYGRFKIETRVKAGSNVVLIFDYLGYKTQQRTFNLQESGNIKIELGKPEEIIVLGGAVAGVSIVSVNQKKSFFKRVWNLIKSPFVKHH